MGTERHGRRWTPLPPPSLSAAGSQQKEGVAERSRSAVPRRRALLAGLLGGAALTGAFAIACGGGKGGAARSATGSAQSGDNARRGGILSQRLPADPPSLDPHQAMTYAGLWPVAPCFNQLVQFDPLKRTDSPADIMADLAERWEQPDPTTIVFTLRRGVKFHDGAEFSAEDVRATVDWLRHPPAGKPSPRQAALEAIDAIETGDGGAVRIKLKRPTPSLLTNLASHTFAIARATDLAANGEVGPKLTGTGPFKLKSYQRGNVIELEKNPAYHVAGHPYLDGLRFYVIADLATALANLAAGQYQLFYDSSLKPSDQARLVQGSGAQFVAELVPGTVRDLVFMNARHKPYNDIRVRQAISLALDRDAAIGTIKEGAARRGGYMTPGGAWALSENELRRIDGYDKPNVERARQLLSEAGAGPLVASTATRVEFKSHAEFVKEGLAAIGINLRLSLSEDGMAQLALQRGDFDISPWLVTINVDDPDATFSELATSTAEHNWSAVLDPQIDALFEKQSQTMDYEERRKAVQELERRALSQYQVAVLFFENLAFARAKRVRNFTFHTSLYTNQRLESVWLES